MRGALFVGGQRGRLRLAGGLHVDVGSLTVARATDHVDAEGQVTLAVRGRGVGGHLAAFVDVSEHVAVGLTYKSATAVRLRGGADFDVPVEFAATLPDQAARSRLVLPDRAALGLAVGSPGLRGLVDVVYTRWSHNEATTFELAASDDVVQRNEWRDTLALHGGLEGRMGPLTWRVGGFVDGLPQPAAPARTLAPSSPEGTRVGSTLGVGAGPASPRRPGEPRAALGVDAFAEVLRILPRTSTSAEAPAARYAGTAVLAGATVALYVGRAGGTSP